MVSTIASKSVNDRQPIHVLGSPLQLTTYGELTAKCKEMAGWGFPISIDFTNTQIVTMRRHEAAFNAITSRVDYFIPDGMPLIWCLNWNKARLKDRVYGPSFMSHCILASPAPVRHYLFGGSNETLARLENALRSENPQIDIVGRKNGYDQPEDVVIADINRLSPDFIWIGLGTPKQQDWIHRNKSRINRGVVFAVGFAFDVIAKTKPDAPLWMQKRGLTWVFRLASEPRRLLGRYIKYNSLFLFYLLWDGLRGRAFKPQ